MVSSSVPYVEPPTSLGKALHIERVRYERKGFGLCIAAFICWAWFFVALDLMKGPWQYLLDNYSEVSVRILFPLSVHKISALIAIIGFYIIYKLESPFLERYKANDNPWPWKADPVKWRALLKRTGPQILFNYIFLAPILQVPVYLKIMEGDVGMFNRTDMASWPTPWELMWQTIFCMIIEDTLFYWGHRTLHHPKLYPIIHKRHHEFTTTVSVAAEYAHPIENFFGNTIPAVAGMVILGPKAHAVSANMWLVMRMIETYEGHSGYDFSWSPFRLLPFSGGQEYHDFHHSHNIGNYSSFFTYWDTACGTNSAFYRYLGKRLRGVTRKTTKQE